MEGILLLNKEIGFTSFDAIRKCSRLIKADKVGHSGTLDPFASGLLVVTVNKATKVNQFIETAQKEYIASLKLGEKTDSGDLDGKIIETQDFDVDEKKIKEVLQSFLGKIKQIPPMYSALKVDGKKLCDLARKGENVERKPREIEIYELELISYEKGIINFRVCCSKGTYVRTLGEDIAEKLNTVGHLISLKRTRVGDYKLEDAYSLSDLEKKEFKLYPIITALTRYQQIKLDEKGVTKAKNGLTFKFIDADDEVLIVDEMGNPIAIYENENGIYRSKRGLF